MFTLQTAKFIRLIFRRHLLNHNHLASYNNFSVLYKCNDSIDTSIIELFLISKLKPCLNNGISLALIIYNNSYFA